MKPDLGLRTAGANIDVRPFQRGLELEVDVELNIRDTCADAALVEECPEPLGLFCREDDGRGITQRGEVGDGPRPADKRLELDPAQVNGICG